MYPFWVFRLLALTPIKKHVGNVLSRSCFLVNELDDFVSPAMSSEGAFTLIHTILHILLHFISQVCAL